MSDDIVWIGRRGHRFTVTTRDTKYMGNVWVSGLVLWEDGTCSGADYATRALFRALIAEKKRAARGGKS
jgi:hypothetical protein